MTETVGACDVTRIDPEHVLIAPKRKPGRPPKVAAPKPVPVETDFEFPDDMFSPTARVVGEVEQERAAQDAVWGTQSHPLIGGQWPDSSRLGYANAALDWQAVNAQRLYSNALGWDGILLEEVYEALAEADPAKARAELVQVAAVAVAMIECIDRSVKV